MDLCVEFLGDEKIRVERDEKSALFWAPREEKDNFRG